MPPLPFSPVGFSGHTERVSAPVRKGKLPRPAPSPLNGDAVGPGSALAGLPKGSVKAPSADPRNWFLVILLIDFHPTQISEI